MDAMNRLIETIPKRQLDAIDRKAIAEGRAITDLVRWTKKAILPDRRSTSSSKVWKGSHA